MSEELWHRAFELAHFLHPDRTIAFRIVLAAMGKLHVARSAQKKRLYYTPKGRNSPHKTITQNLRSKVSATEHLLLQRLVYIESEYYERQREAARSGHLASEDDMLVYYIKHLIRISLKRNSFYLTLGLSRLLYSYSTAAAMEIYSVMVQDPDRVKDDYYFRSRKAVLLRELKERFGTLLNTCRGPHGEERVKQNAPVEHQQKLVHECLSVFTPWWTNCTLPPKFDPVADEIAALSGGNSHDENKAELNRLHSVLHPECYARVVDALKLDAPHTKLMIPHFTLSKQNGNGGNTSTRHPTRLTDQEISALQKELEKQSARRKKSSPAWMRVCVDGLERARLDADEKQEAQFLIEEGDELLEVQGFDKNSGGELLFGCHVLDWTGNGVEPLQTAIALPHGKRIHISASPPGTVTVSFKHAWSLRDYLANLIYPSFGLRARWALGLVLIVGILLLGSVIIRQFRSPSPSPHEKQRAGVSETPQPTVAPSPQIQETPTRKPTGRDSNLVAQIPKQADSGAELTRSPQSQIEGKALSEIKNVFLVFVGGDIPGLSDRLQSSGRFNLTNNGDTADAHLKLTVQKANKRDQLNVIARLVNARGDVVWARRYRGSASNISEAISRDLESAN